MPINQKGGQSNDNDSMYSYKEKIRKQMDQSFNVSDDLGSMRGESPLGKGKK
jgi:hypothetical protein